MTSAYGSEQLAGVIVGAQLNGLGVARSLAPAGVPIIAVDTRNTSAGLWSRHVSGYFIKSFIGKSFADDMIELGKKFSRPPVLILTDEDAVHAVSENRDALSHWFRFRLPVDDTVKMLSNKARFHDFAQQHNFPVPRSVILERPADIEYLSELRYPCVLKPEDKRNVLRGDKERAVRVDSLHEARERALAMLNSPGGIIAQEWIEGPDSNIHFTLFYRGDGGNVVSVFTGRKVLSSPPGIGNTAICIAAPEARAALEPMTLAFAEQAGFDGMGSIEYKWDDNHRRFVMVEPTVGRTDWQEEIATLSGVNIPLSAYRHEVGLPPIPDRPSRVPVAWRASFTDHVPPDVLPESTRIVDGYFRWQDPFPALQFYCLLSPLRRMKRRWLAIREVDSRHVKA
ncbi:Predicted ATP-dependent carboligase, ATP-grasp superfamily [Paraburkholderia fungorum]|uniref:Predicted ATP-dependent carboligase, ATP-grasp superfamily n=1 Tax=Paraburkholderia fungorum TaxID=134537 RepID=A0A1H0ZTF9_9BURK|nr:carboxylate--amine ligase [Paraburkholderia fungorum]SDQ30734.1 Predicted ATP-dependent carboligase, ATP-grasp superfamily [Paraburkholderia fungorum]